MKQEDNDNEENKDRLKKNDTKEKNKVELKGSAVNYKPSKKCIDRHISKQQSLIDRQITQTYDNAIWIEEHKIFEMLERKTSHADPELTCIITYWKKRIRLGRCQREFCGTSYEAHIIGAMTGLLVGFLWLKNRRFKTWVIVLKRVLRYVLFGVIISFLIAIIAKISQSRPCFNTGQPCTPWIDGKCCERLINTGIGPCCLSYVYNATYQPY